MAASQTISAADFSALHPDAIRDSSEISALLARARDDGVVLSRGMNRQVLPERAWLHDIDGERLVLRTENFESTGRDQVFLRFSLGGLPYFFSAERLSEEDSSPLLVARPSCVFQFERRERLRTASGQERSWIALDGCRHEGSVLNVGPAGGCIELQGDITLSEGARVVWERSGGQEDAVVVGTSRSSSGWLKVHLSSRPGGGLEPNRRRSIFARSATRRVSDSLRLGVQGGLQFIRDRLGVHGRSADEAEVVRFYSEDKEDIVGLVNRSEKGAGGVVVLIPPAWGRTKETLLPLAAVLQSSFDKSGLAGAVLRFDGIRKRGESRNDPGCEVPGREHHRFSFYQGVKDIRAAARFARSELAADKVVLVTFSASSIEGRKFLAEDVDADVDGWVSVVGSADMQSMMRVISGGVDYAAGFERGLRFGLQEILGVTVDIDFAGRDAMAHEMAFFEDSLQDMAKIAVPIRWLHGKHDAWMDLGRVSRLLASDDPGNRQLEVVPCGHQLRSSSEALEVFQRIVELVGEVGGEPRLEPGLPAVSRLAAMRRSERDRKPRADLNLREFWADYLLGRSGGLGIELMNRTDAYQAFVDRMIATVARDSRVVVDLGCGVGSNAMKLSAEGRLLVGLDLVAAAAKRARDRVGAGFEAAACDCSGSIPLADSSVDVVFASLFLSYLPDPDACLGEIRRVLRSGGQLVLSSMRPDADLSLIYTSALADVRAGVYDAHYPGIERADLLAAGRSFLNDAARLIDLEEAGQFEFWTAEALVQMLGQAGFAVVETGNGFGDPAQACFVVAESE